MPSGESDHEGGNLRGAESEVKTSREAECGGVEGKVEKFGRVVRAQRWKSGGDTY